MKIVNVATGVSIGVGTSVRVIEQRTLAIALARPQSFAAVLLALSVTGCFSPPTATTPSIAPSTPPPARCSDPAAPKEGCRWQGKDSQAGCGKRLICASLTSVVNI